MRMLKAGRELNFAPESVGVYRAGEMFGEKLEDDSPLQCSIECDEQPAHPPTAELPLEDVGVTELRFESGAKIRQRARFRRRCGKLWPSPYRRESTSARDAAENASRISDYCFVRAGMIALATKSG